MATQNSSAKPKRKSYSARKRAQSPKNQQTETTNQQNQQTEAETMNLEILKKNLKPEAADSSASSVTASTSDALPAPLDPAAMNRVPGVVAEEQGGELAGGSGESVIADEIRGMLDELGDFLEDDVKDVLEEAFEFLAEYFGSDHWKLTPRQQRMLARPVSRLLNHLWSKLKDKLPEMLSNLAETTPGVAGLIIAVPIVVGPKVMKQVAIRRERKAKELEEQNNPKSEPEERWAPGAMPPPGGSDGGQRSLR